jgi:hypothetical protein
MFGYSDDNWILAPSLDGLREMMKTIEDYCNLHNLRFSTDPNPRKCKTKCVAFLKKERDLPSIYLCGNPLPWVKEGIHLGNNFENQYNIHLVKLNHRPRIIGIRLALTHKLG